MGKFQTYILQLKLKCYPDFRKAKIYVIFNIFKDFPKM